MKNPATAICDSGRSTFKATIYSEMEEKQIVICGGGIIGCSVAYFLTKFGQTRVTVVECHAVAGQASGKAGGFLALDWHHGRPAERLARRSFQLHEEVSRELAPRDVGYRKMNTWSATINEADGVVDAKQGAEVPEWIGAKVMHCASIGTVRTTAQVHPYKLTTALLEVAQERGASVVRGKVTGIRIDGDKVTGVKVDEKILDADVVVIAMGPWSGKAASFFPKSGLPRFSGSRAHSILLQTDGTNTIGADALFLSYKLVEGGSAEAPEVYPRGDGTVYICGDQDNSQLPEDPKDVSVDPKKCDVLLRLGKQISRSVLTDETVTKQACYLPNSPDSDPIIGQICGYSGAFIATGHTCWGILNSLATGESLAQMILGIQPTVDLTQLSPRRFSR